MLATRIRELLGDDYRISNSRTYMKYLIILLVVIVTMYMFVGRSKRQSPQVQLHSLPLETRTTPYLSIWNPSAVVRKTAIAILFDGEMVALAPKIEVLDTFLSDNLTSDVIIFHTGYAPVSQLYKVASSTKRQVIFYNIDVLYPSFPKGFDPYLEEPTWSKRGKWNYHQMCRFWFKLVLDIPLINKYEYVMRLDSDSKIIGVWFNVFDFMRNKSAINFANIEQADTEAILPGLMKLKTFTLEYQLKYRIVPKNPERFVRAFDTPYHIRLHNTNFDIFKVAFFKSAPVAHWMNAVDESCGIFRYRWGDHVLRYLTTALFANASEVLVRTDYNLPYCHPC